MPYQLSNELFELENKFGYSSEPGGILRNKLHITRGAQMIYNMLNDGYNDVFPEVISW